jgi:predicted nuclease of predicted toxin-antitoxin system
MIIWTDAHLSPAIAVWMTANFDVMAFSLRDLGLRDAEDPEILQRPKLRV